MSSKTAARIQKELHECESLNGICVYLVSNNDIYCANAIINGPTDTPYFGGNFELTIHFSSLYPFRPPCVKFITKIFHCNIDDDGNICLDILKDQWVPTLSLRKILLAIVALLEHPNSNDPLSPKAAKLFVQDKQEYNSVATSWTVAYAT